MIVTVQPNYGGGDSSALAFLGSLGEELELRYPEIVTVNVVTEDDRHIIELREDGWTIQHPNVERDGGDLFNCSVTKAVQQGVWIGDFERFGRFYCEWTRDDKDRFCLLIQEPVAP